MIKLNEMYELTNTAFTDEILNALNSRLHININRFDINFNVNEVNISISDNSLSCKQDFYTATLTNGYYKELYIL